MTSRPLIIGAGPAGCAAALALVAQGRSATILERTQETGDAICGGFLSWRSLATLERLGIEGDALGGHCVSTVRLFHGEQMVARALPQPGMGVSRYRLDTVMQALAVARGAGLERGVRVKALVDGIVTTADGATLSGAAIFLASGKHGLPGERRDAPNPARGDPVTGLRCRLPANDALHRLIGGAVELFLFDRGYIGLVEQEDGSGNLCLAVHKSRLAEAGGKPEQLIAQWAGASPALAARLAAGAMGPADAIGAVPYGWQYRGDAGDSAWRLGDQAAVIPSLAGEGMGIALYSAVDAAAAFGDGMAADMWQRRLAARLRRPMLVARTAWAIAESPRAAGPALGLLGMAPPLIDLMARLTRVPG